MERRHSGCSLLVAALSLSGSAVDTRAQNEPMVMEVLGVEASNEHNPAPYGTYFIFVVEFSEGVLVSGSPRLALGIGDATRHAAYVGSYPFTIDEAPCANGECSLLFRYFIQESDSDMDGVSVARHALELDGGAIRGSDGAPATLDLGAHAIVDDPNLRVDGSRSLAPATVESIDVLSTPASDATYGVGETVRVRIDMNAELIVNGAPRLLLTIGDAARYARYSGRVGEPPAPELGPAALDFAYMVRAEDHDADGLGIPADAIDLNGGSIVNGIAGVATPILADLSHPVVSDLPDHKVSGGVQADACRVGQELRPGESCTVEIPGLNVGSNRFEVRSDGRGCYGSICSSESLNLSGFRASKIAGTARWRIDALPPTVPALPPAAMLVLALVLVGGSWLHRRRAQATWAG